MFQIGEFSKLGQVSPRMLRHYDQLGLLIPGHVDRWTVHPDHLRRRVRQSLAHPQRGNADHARISALAFEVAGQKSKIRSANNLN